LNDPELEELTGVEAGLTIDEEQQQMVGADQREAPEEPEIRAAQQKVPEEPEARVAQQVAS
jgi:hypothetical protein